VVCITARIHPFFFGILLTGPIFASGKVHIPYTKEKQVEEKIARREKRIEEPVMVSHRQSEDIAFLFPKGFGC
jgi:hypothetical protein